MAMIASIRSPMPAGEALHQPPTETRANPHRGIAAPVSATLLAEAPQQIEAKSGAGDPLLLAARMTSETSAAAAAEAARDAYIKASIAAGISPLPLP